MCATMTQSTVTHCYHLIPVCHNDTKYIDTLLSSNTCVPQWHKVQWHIVIILYMCATMTYTHRHIVIILYLCVRMTQSTVTHCYHLIHVCHNDTKYTWHIVVILYMCVTMTQSTLTHCYHLIHVCHNDTKYSDTLLSYYTCVSQWHKVQWHIAFILYMCVTMAQSTLTHCYHLIHVCHNDTKYTDKLLSSYTFFWVIFGVKT